MAKNIIVIDEQGNEYEATYPKRAKGLVKSGRARFVDENKICLACPPKEYLEDKMNNIDNKDITANTTDTEMSASTERALTAREIFDKISDLQKQLTENSYHSLHRLDDSITSICDIESEDKDAQVAEICSVFKMRETTLLRILEIYERMYDDLTSPKAMLINKAMEVIKSSNFSSAAEFAEAFDSVVGRLCNLR